MFLLVFFILEFILGFAPEPFEILIFAIGLVLLTVGLRWLMNRGAENVRREDN